MVSLLALAAFTFAQVPANLPTLGSVDFTPTQDQIIVPAELNGHKLHLIFDTGFGATVITDDSVDIGKPTGHSTLVDFVGTVDVATVPIKSLKLGDMSVKTQGGDDAMQQDGIGEMGDGVHIDGLMGFSAIKNYVTQISFQNKKFIFYPNSVDISKWKPNNKTTFLVPMEPIGADAIVLKVLGPDGKDLLMALDTGNAFYATTYTESLVRLGLWKADENPKYSFLSGVASGAVQSWDKNLKNMTIFGVPVPDSTWDVISRPSAEATSDGTVGFQFLKNFNIVFDFKRRLVWLDNWTGKTGNEVPGSLGFSAYYIRSKNSYVISLVAPSSPADKAGIQKGDELLEVNGEELGPMSFYQFRALTQGPVGSKCAITFAHDGIAKRVVLTREALVN